MGGEDWQDHTECAIISLSNWMLHPDSVMQAVVHYRNQRKAEILHDIYEILLTWEYL
jgi:hypothetical protein